VCLVCELD